MMEVSYTGRLTNGTTFSSSVENGKPMPGLKPQSFRYIPGKDKLILGLQVILKEMKAGGKVLIVLPPELGYGVNGFYAKDIPGQKRFVISPGEKLIIELTVTKIEAAGR